MPLGLLVGALALLAHHRARTRRHLAASSEKSRYLHLVAAMMLPALGVAADAVMRRWRSRWLTVAVIAVLVVRIPGNLNVIVDYMHTADRQEPGAVQGR